jgi:hypothetical protein
VTTRVDPIERLRAALRVQAPAPLRIGARRTQWAFDEDTEGYCDIEVLDPEAPDRFLLVVVRGDVPAGRRGDFMVRFWRRFGAEVWLVGDAALQRHPAGDPYDAASDAPRAAGILTSSALPWLAIDLDAVFAAG